MWLGYAHGEILPEDIDQFSKLKDVQDEQTSSVAAWRSVLPPKPEVMTRLRDVAKVPTATFGS